MASSTPEIELIAQSSDIGGSENFPQGCSFSPDGLCVLTTSVADSKLRLYNTLAQTEARNVQEWKTSLVADGGQTVRSYSWYPHMKSSDPATCCFLASARDQPIQLYDAYQGTVRATYRPFNRLDEIESASVASFNLAGDKIVAAGFYSDRMIHVFDASRPGRESTTAYLGKTRRSSDGQKGLVSAIAFAPNYFAVGTYSPGSIYLYDDRLGQQPTGSIVSGLCIVGHGRSHSRKKRRFVEVSNNGDEDTIDALLSDAKSKWFVSRAQGGVTQLRFLPQQDFLLYSASRRSDAIIAWDLRMLSDNPDHKSRPVQGLASYQTSSQTNQRLEFDIDSSGSKLYTGGLDGCVRVYDVASGNLLHQLKDLGDAANGVSVCNLPGRKETYLAVASGSRAFPSENDLDDESQPHSSGRLGLYTIANLE